MALISQNLLVQGKFQIAQTILLHKLIILLSHLAGYSTANTPEAAYIIGGFVTKNLVAEFRDDQWALLDDLSKSRYRQGSITVGSQTMIVGGWDPK